MSERKVLNKYYPPDFDPSKIPRMKLARNRQYTVRLMAPFNMRCKTCGEYIYKGKKFNARKEDVEGDDYLGIRIYRFYIKCTRCLQEISFKTDPKNTDYEIEAGATRNFMALKLAEEQAQREEDEKKEEEATNPMKLLEKRTQQSKQELELLESLEELKDLNRRQQIIDYDQMLKQFDTEAVRRKIEKEQEEQDERYVQSIFNKKSGRIIEEEIIELKDEDNDEPLRKISKRQACQTLESNLSMEVKDNEKQSDRSSAPSTSGTSLWCGNVGVASNKTNVTNLVKKKASLGIRLNPNNVKVVTEVNKSDTQTVEIAKTKEMTANVKSTDTVQVISTKGETATASNGLSMLGAYSDSSDNDSDHN